MIVFVTGSETETTPTQRFERLLELPPSAKLVYRVLAAAGDPLTQGQIRRQSLLPARTTREALANLKDEDLVEERRYVLDARKRLYAHRPVADAEEVGLPE